MRLCIPTADDRGRAARLSDHFGSAPYFTIVDDASGSVDVIRNGHARHQPGHCDAAEGLASHRVDAVLCLGLGRRALAGLGAAGIRVFMTPAGDVDGALEAFRAGRTVPLTPETACAGGQRVHCS
jgi:predicted Fe-Mo cluster-binding NifX family protein